MMLMIGPAYYLVNTAKVSVGVGEDKTTIEKINAPVPQRYSPRTIPIASCIDKIGG